MKDVPPIKLPSIKVYRTPTLTTTNIVGGFTTPTTPTLPTPATSQTVEDLTSLTQVLRPVIDNGRYKANPPPKTLPPISVYRPPTLTTTFKPIPPIIPIKDPVLVTQPQLYTPAKKVKRVIDVEFLRRFQPKKAVAKTREILTPSLWG